MWTSILESIIFMNYDDSCSNYNNKILYVWKDWLHRTKERKFHNHFGIFLCFEILLSFNSNRLLNITKYKHYELYLSVFTLKWQYNMRLNLLILMEICLKIVLEYFSYTYSRKWILQKLYNNIIGWCTNSITIYKIILHSGHQNL